MAALLEGSQGNASPLLLLLLLLLIRLLVGKAETFKERAAVYTPIPRRAGGERRHRRRHPARRGVADVEDP